MCFLVGFSLLFCMFTVVVLRAFIGHFTPRISFLDFISHISLCVWPADGRTLSPAYLRHHLASTYAQQAQQQVCHLFVMC
jgi:hypothetical protein